jgi:hypothetical protein
MKDDHVIFTAVFPSTSGHSKDHAGNIPDPSDRLPFHFQNAVQFKQADQGNGQSRGAEKQKFAAAVHDITSATATRMIPLITLVQNFLLRPYAEEDGTWISVYLPPNRRFSPVIGNDRIFQVPTF